ncbi:MAG TPA: glycosyltransferase 87 family protein [Thermomicrobiales bacterium]|nr:glycosyltransferase 87 family protein [Thermomicrobiales bacterium]
MTALWLMASAVVSTMVWLKLKGWWGLFENRERLHLSFERADNGFQSHALQETLQGLVLLTILYGTVVALLATKRPLNVWAKAGLVGLVVGPAVGSVLIYPVGALDVFNYMIELKLTYHYDQNPYLVTFRNYVPDSYAGPAFLTDVKLFYGPAWLVITGIPARLVGFYDYIDTLVALKVFNALLIGVTGAIVAWSAGVRDRRWLALAMFAANPLVLFEGNSNGHNDVLLTVFVAGAMLALQRKSPLAGPLLALSALVKLYTVALLPIFIVVALKGKWGWQRITLTVAATAITVVAVSTPYWGEGELVTGLRAGLEESQEMDHVSPLSLARQYAQQVEAETYPNPTFPLSRPSFEIVPQSVQDQIDLWFTVAFVICVLALALAVWFGRPPELAAAETLLLLFLLMTNLYPWYLIPVIALMAMRPDRWSRWYVILATLAGLVYYPMFVFGHYNSGWSRFHIHQFLAIFLVGPILIYGLARIVTWRRLERWNTTPASTP